MTDSSSQPFSARLGEKLIRWLGKARSHGRSLRQARSEPLLAPVPSLLLMAGLSALSSTTLVFILNRQITAAGGLVPSVGVGVIFLIVVIVSWWSGRLALSRSGALVEQALHTRRIRVVNEIFQLTLKDTETLTRGRAVDGMTRHYQTLSQAVIPLMQGLQSAILCACLLAYLCWLSLPAGAMVIGIGGLLVYGSSHAWNEWMGREGAINQSNSLLNRMSEQVLDGFKELRLNLSKRQAFCAQVVNTCANGRDLRTGQANLFALAFSMIQVTAYLLVGTIVILLPILSTAPVAHNSQLAVIALFLVGPMMNLTTLSQQVALARFALAQVDEFEAQVMTLVKQPLAEAAVPPPFEQLQVQQLGYTHAPAKDGKPGFSVSNFSLAVRRGSITFITGQNGAGKTTLLRLLTGLYPSHSGQISVNGIPLPGEPDQAYRDYFAAVFADNHLFSQPYGLDAAGLLRLQPLLEQFDIAQKLPADLTQGYDPAVLSTGQRKRLALALALAEDRPVLVLDEWAADQDAASRKAFYTTVLPGLAAAGKAVVAVTHDERYFGVADVHYEIKDGQLTLAGAV